MSEMMLFTGNANRPLAEKVAKHLGKELGKATVGHFSDGEIMVEILENVRGQDIFIMQPTCPPVNSNLMELIIMADALRPLNVLPPLFLILAMVDKTAEFVLHVFRLPHAWLQI